MAVLPPCSYGCIRPIATALLIYFGVSLISQILARFDPPIDSISRFIIAYGGTPLVLIVLIGVVWTIRNSEKW